MSKSGILHERQKRVASTNVQYVMVEQCKYLGCAVDEHLKLKSMVEERALALELFGVGTLDPKVSLLAEMEDLRVKWLARMRCVTFWGKILTSRTYDGRLLRQIAAEAVRFGRGTWICKMSTCRGQFGWKDVHVELVFCNSLLITA